MRKDFDEINESKALGIYEIVPRPEVRLGSRQTSMMEPFFYETSH